jgi:hypothetical protein
MALVVITTIGGSVEMYIAWQSTATLNNERCKLTTTRANEANQPASDDNESERGLFY